MNQKAIHPSARGVVSRRSFLQVTVGIFAAPMVAPPIVFGAQAPSKQLNIGCIGVGRMGRGDMNESLYQGLDTNARVVAVCDLDSQRARDAATVVNNFYKEKLNKSDWNCQAYGDFRELLAQKDIDGVNIVTPDHWHALLAIAAAQAGKGIYLEKPLTYSVVEGQKLIEAVRKNKVILQTGSQQRSDVYFRKTCELVRNGRIGKLQTIEVVLPADQGSGNATPMPVPENLNYAMWLGPTPEAPYTEDRVHPQKGFGRPGWLQIEQYCRGMITGWGAHMYDIAQWGLGTDTDSGPVEVEATAEFPKRGLFDVHVDYKAEARYANGVKLVSHSGTAGVKFIGEQGWIWVTRGKYEAHDRNLFREKIGPDGIKLYESKNHMANFLECLRSRKDPAAPVEVGHRSNSVCVLHHIAMKLGRKLRWDPKAERFVNDDAANALLDFAHRPPWTV